MLCSAHQNTTLIIKGRAGDVAELKQFLMFWLEDQMQRKPLSLGTIEAKSRSLFENIFINFRNSS